MASELPMTAARPVSLEEAELHYHTALALTAPAQPDIEDMDTSHLRINSAMAQHFRAAPINPSWRTNKGGYQSDEACAEQSGDPNSVFCPPDQSYHHIATATNVS